MEDERDIIIYKTDDGKANVILMAKDGNIWMNQNQLAELFDTSKQNIGQHIKSILEDNELDGISVVKNYFTTASDGKKYEVTFYSLDMILAIGFRVRSKRGTQFRIWANKNLKEYMIKGFVMDDERLKNPDGRPDYFELNMTTLNYINKRLQILLLFLPLTFTLFSHGIERHSADMKRIFPFVANNPRNKDVIDFYYTINAFIDYRSFPSNERKVGRPLCIAEHPKFGKMKFGNHRIWFHWGFNKDPKKFDPLAKLVDQNIERGIIRESDRAEFWQVVMQEVSKRNRYLMNEWSKILGYEGLGNMSAAMRAQSNAFVTMLYSIHLLGDHQTKLTDIMLNINSVYGDVYNAVDNLAGRSQDNRKKANRLKAVLRKAQDDPRIFLDVLEREFTPFLYSLEGGIYNYKKRFEDLGYILK